jgi:hypothetical protein
MLKKFFQCILAVSVVGLRPPAIGLEISKPQYVSVKISNLKYMVFNQGVNTITNRTDSSRQIHVEGIKSHNNDLVVCEHKGYYNGEWTLVSCKSKYSYEINRPIIVCEGYHKPDDDHVIKGSCHVEYITISAFEFTLYFCTLIAILYSGIMRRRDFIAYLMIFTLSLSVRKSHFMSRMKIE